MAANLGSSKIRSSKFAQVAGHWQCPLAIGSPCNHGRLAGISTPAVAGHGAFHPIGSISLDRRDLSSSRRKMVTGATSVTIPPVVLFVASSGATLVSIEWWPLSPAARSLPKVKRGRRPGTIGLAVRLMWPGLDWCAMKSQPCSGGLVCQQAVIRCG